jgi:hypothetical protein
MSVAFRSFASKVATSNATSVAVICPVGTTTGDLMLFFAADSRPTAFGTVPTGWTLLTKPSGTSTNLASACWYKIATGSDVAGTTSYTATAGGTSGPIVGAILTYTGINSTLFPRAATKYGLTHGTTSATTSSVPTNPTSLGATDLVLRAYIAGFTASGTGRTLGASPAGWTPRGTGSLGPTAISSGFQVGMVVGDQLAGFDLLTTTSSPAAVWDVYTVAIPAKPPPPGVMAQFMPFLG